MAFGLQWLKAKVTILSKKDKHFKQNLQHLIGFKPNYLPFYQKAFSVVSNPEENNERLEFLGDALLGAIVAEFVFKKYPYQSEGFLTEIRSRMVRRETLNKAADEMGLETLIVGNNDKLLRSFNVSGNALEALIGAIYLDKGYLKTKLFITKYLIKGYLNMEVVETTDNNHKKRLLDWAQKNKKQISFEDLEEEEVEKISRRRIFKVQIILDNQLLLIGTGYNKKQASQNGALKALKELNIE